MPSEEPDPRIDALQEQVGKLTDRVRASEQDAAAARILAGAADRDVDEFRGELRGVRGDIADIRGDIADMRGEIGDMRGEIGDMRGEIGDMRGEIGDLRSDMRGEIGDLRSDMRGEIADVRGEFRSFRRATTASFNALREDMTDLRTHVDNGFIEMRGKFDATAAGQERIVELLEGLIAGQG